MQSPNRGRKKKATERDQSDSIDLSKLLDSGKQEEGKTFHKLHALGMNDDLWGRVRGIGSETWKGSE